MQGANSRHCRNMPLACKIQIRKQTPNHSCEVPGTTWGRVVHPRHRVRRRPPGWCGRAWVQGEAGRGGAPEPPAGARAPSPNLGALRETPVGTLSGGQGATKTAMLSTIRVVILNCEKRRTQSLLKKKKRRQGLSNAKEKNVFRSVLDQSCNFF